MSTSRLFLRVFALGLAALAIALWPGADVRACSTAVEQSKPSGCCAQTIKKACQCCDTGVAESDGAVSTAAAVNAPRTHSADAQSGLASRSVPPACGCRGGQPASSPSPKQARGSDRSSESICRLNGATPSARVHFLSPIFETPSPADGERSRSLRASHLRL